MSVVYTKTQGQYLSFIYYYTKTHCCPPAEADFITYFKVASSSIHQMIISLERKGFISRIAGQGRSIALLLNKADLPDLD